MDIFESIRHPTINILADMQNNTNVNLINEGNLPQMIIIGLILIILIIACIVGNLFVIIAIIVERDLRNRPHYYLIFSLAVADLLVGLIVTPLGAWTTVVRSWKFGVILCDFWISMDVLVCTSSILHLVAIALDRYWSITDITYVQNRTPRRIFSMLAIVWVVSLLISVAPIFGWKDADFLDRVKKQHVCLISQQISYQVFSTTTAFYIPLCAIICIYYKIMRAAKRRFKRERDRKTICRVASGNAKINKQKNLKRKRNLLKINIYENYADSSDEERYTTTHSNGHYCINETCLDANKIKEITENSLDSAVFQREISSTMGTSNIHVFLEGIDKSKQINTLIPKIRIKKRRRAENAEMKRERKAWRTLAIITGTFVACWTPFFLISLYRPMCRCKIPILLESITNWLGYLNSALNPIIYTVFSLDFRLAFKRLVKRLIFMRCLL